MATDTLTLPESLLSAVKQEARRARVRPETVLARAVRQYLEDVADIQAARAEIKRMRGKKWASSEQVKKELGLAD